MSPIVEAIGGGGDGYLVLRRQASNIALFLRLPLQRRLPTTKVAKDYFTWASYRAPRNECLGAVDGSDGAVAN